MTTIKEIVENALKEKGITAKKMCEDLEMPEQTLYQIFRKNTGRQTTLNKIGDYLGISLNISFSYGELEEVTTLQKIVDYLKKENQFLRNYIDENLMVNMGKYKSGLAQAFGSFFYSISTQKPTHLNKSGCFYALQA